MGAATLAILAGGEGRRMGRPKAELRVDGRPILSYLLDRFAWSGPTLLVTAPGREHPPGWDRFGREVSDAVAGQGPLRGVLTALEAAETELVVVTTCDMPRLSPPHFAWVVETLVRQPAATIVMLSHAGRIEPFPLAARATALDDLRAHFDRGERAMHSVLKVPAAIAVPVPPQWDDAIWTNLNTPADIDGIDSAG